MALSRLFNYLQHFKGYLCLTSLSHSMLILSTYVNNINITGQLFQLVKLKVNQEFVVTFRKNYRH